MQANGFQIVEDDRSDRTYTETGASYMGYAVSALLSSAFAANPRQAIAFSGDGSSVLAAAANAGHCLDCATIKVFFAREHRGEGGFSPAANDIPVNPLHARGFPSIASSRLTAPTGILSTVTR